MIIIYFYYVFFSLSCLSCLQVIVDNVEMHSALPKAFEIIGYCPQTDAIESAVTAKEFLVFYGISSGFTKSQAQDVAE